MEFNLAQLSRPIPFNKTWSVVKGCAVQLQDHRFPAKYLALCFWGRQVPDKRNPYTALYSYVDSS